MERVAARAREERVGEDLRKKLSKVYTGATRVQSHACTWHVYGAFRSYVAVPTYHASTLSRTTTLEKSVQSHAHMGGARRRTHARGENVRTCTNTMADVHEDSETRIHKDRQGT